MGINKTLTTKKFRELFILISVSKISLPCGSDGGGCLGG
jgi:hypothetical protein